MTYVGPVPTNQNKPIFKDATVTALSSMPNSGTPNAAQSLLGLAEEVEFSIKREFTSTRASADDHQSSRAIAWGNGSVTIRGFSLLAGSPLPVIFGAASHTVLQFTEATSGDSYVLLCQNEEFRATMGKEANKQSMTLPVEGVPFFGAAGATPSAMTLEV